MKPPRPENDSERVRALRRYEVLDTADEPAFDRITQLAARLFDAPIAIVSLVDEHRQWSKSCVGLDGRQADRDAAFCSYVVLSPQPFIVEDATLDPRFSSNPAVTQAPFVRFYAGAPLTTRDGFNLGTLCIVDRQPRKLSDRDIRTLVDLAQIVVDELELRLGYRARALFQKVCELSPSFTYLYDRVKHERSFLGRGVLEALGYDGQRSASDLLPEIVHPEDLPRLYRHLGQLDLLEGEPMDISLRIRHRDGTWRWFLTRETVFDRDEQGRVSQVIGIATDVTALKTTELRLEQSEELLAGRVRVLEGILASAGEGIAVVDEHSRFTVFNPAARRIMGHSPQLGSPQGPDVSSALLEPESRQPYPSQDLPLARAVRGESSDNVELLIRKADSAETLIRVTGRPLQDERGNPRGGIITFNDITALRAAERELARRALTDPLTGLGNRRAFDERLALLVNEGCRGRPFALVLADVDHFKKVNDTHGHSMGDEVLAHVGKILKGHVRCTDFVGRYGGEEFCVLFTDVDESVATRLADNLRRAIADHNGPVPITVSFGVCANRPTERADPTALFKAADRALYAAKNQGRNRVVAAQLTARESIPRLPRA